MSKRMWRRPYMVELGFRSSPEAGGYSPQHDTFVDREQADEWALYHFNGTLVGFDPVEYVIVLERNARGEWETIEEYMP